MAAEGCPYPVPRGAPAVKGSLHPRASRRNSLPLVAGPGMGQWSDEHQAVVTKAKGRPALVLTWT